MDNVDLFLRESNAIEGVWDEWDKQSLVDARKAWDYLISFNELTKENILKCHDILMEKHLPISLRGRFRDVRIFVGGRQGTPVSELESEFAAWLKVANFDLLGDKEVHVAFEKIHPFIDGNGRTGRIIMNWQRVKSGSNVLVIYEKEKYNYYKWFD